MRGFGKRRPGTEDGFALVLSLLLILVVAGLSLAMAGVILNQVKPTQQARKRVQTINAAQSGLQAALQKMRQADDGTGTGLITNLPCSSKTGAGFSRTGGSARTLGPGVTLTGSVSGPAATSDPKYEVAIAYFQVNPAGWSVDDLTKKSLPCPLKKVPLFVYLQSYGTTGQVPGDNPTAGNRTQVATYEFKLTNINIVGGRLRSYGTQQCLDAGNNPMVGRALTMQPCLPLGTPNQTWQYRKDLSIFYGGDTSLDLCIEAAAPNGTPVLRTCTGSGAGSTFPYGAGQQVQEWGFNDNGHFSAGLFDGTVTNGGGGACLQPRGAGGNTAAASGADLILTSCDSNTGGPAAFDPDPQVGAGKAGGDTTGTPGATKQYVNYAQFGRCLDITGQNVNADHLIAYPCKQAPDSTKLTFNQVWTYSGTQSTFGTFSVNNGSRYCLTVPMTGDLVRTPPCAGPPTDVQLWRATGEIVGNYPGSFTLVNKSNGACLGVSPLSEALTNASSNIVARTCDGSNAQKWNAPPGGPPSRLANIQENGS